MLFEINPAARVGLTYRSQVDQDFDDVASVSNLGPGLRALLNARGLLGRPVDMSLTIPQEVMLSGYWEITPTIAILGNFDWQNWSQFGEPQLTVSTTSLTIDQNYDDTFGVAAGTQIRVMDPLLLSLGFAFDSSAVWNRPPHRGLPRRRPVPLGARAGLQPQRHADRRHGVRIPPARVGAAHAELEPSGGRCRGISRPTS